MIVINDYLNLFSPVHQEKPRFMALAEAVLSQAADLLALIQQSFPEALSLETAVGAQLDTLGGLLNIPRPAGASDADYRFLLNARIACRHWDGSNDTLPDVLARIFPGRDVQLLDNQDGSVTARVSGTLPFPLSELLPFPAGIQLKEEGENN